MSNINFSSLTITTDDLLAEHKTLIEKTKYKASTIEKVVDVCAKAKEAESAAIRKIVACRRRCSLPTLQALSAQSSKKAKLAAKTGEIWECIDYAPNAFQGKLYTFKIKFEYDPLQNKNHKQNYLIKTQAMFPAIEPSAEFAAIILSRDDMFVNSYINEIRDRIFFGQMRDCLVKNIECLHQALPVLYSLGYDYKADKTGTYLVLPNRKALLARWYHLKANNFDLPDLNIVDSKGVANDLAFIEAYFIGDALLSSGKEFVHDHINHLVNILALIITSRDHGASYQRDKFLVVKLIANAYRKIIFAKKKFDQDFFSLDRLQRADSRGRLTQMEAALGSFVDILSSRSVLRGEDGKLVRDEASMEHHLSILTAEHSQWKAYYIRRFGEKKYLRPEEMLKQWVLFDNDSSD